MQTVGHDREVMAVALTAWQKRLAKELCVKQTPDPTPKVVRKTHGRRTQLGVREFLAALFELNERLPKKRKMTDAEILRQFHKEFPDRRPADPSAYLYQSRYWYNTGKLIPTAQPKPPVTSLRYNGDGDPIGPLRGRHVHRDTRPMTLDEIRAVCRRYPAVDEHPLLKG